MNMTGASSILRHGELFPLTLRLDIPTILHRGFQAEKFESCFDILTPPSFIE